MIQVGKPVKGKEFIGREQEIKDIINYIKIGQSVVIIAPRRFGKTSLVNEILVRLKKQKSYTGYIDVFEHSRIKELSRTIVEEVIENHGLKKLYQQTKGSISALLKSVKLKAVVEDYEFLIGLEDSTVHSWDNFKSSLDFINDFGENNNKSMCFAFDEYGDILKFDQASDIIKLMRAKIQKQQAASYIFSGSYESVMDTLFIDNKSPFYRLAKIIHISYLPFDKVFAYMSSKLKEYNIKHDKELVEQSIDFLKGHPYYCQLALQQIYLYSMSRGKSPTINELIDILLYNEQSYLEKIWESISGSKENTHVLKHLSTQSTGVYAMATSRQINASRAIKQLEGKGIIYKEGSGYQYYDPLFQYWVSERIKG